MTAQFPTQTFNWRRLWLAALVGIGFGAGVVATTLAAPRTDADRPPTGGAAIVPAATVGEYAAYRSTMANLATAVARHDMPSAANYRTMLDGQLTASVIQGLYADRARILGDMAAAQARHDRRLYEEFKLQLGALCPAISVGSVPSFCN